MEQMIKKPTRYGADIRKPSKKERVKRWLKSATEKVENGLAWIWEDMKKKHLIWVKIIFLFQSASLVTLYPYLTIHMRSIGLTTAAIAIVNTCIPVADFIPPLAGLLADKLGNFRAFMGFITFLNGLASLALVFIPNVAQVSAFCCHEGPGKSYELLCYPLPESADILSLSYCDVAKNGTSIVTHQYALNDTGGFPDPCFVECKLPIENADDHHGWISNFSVYLCVRVALDILRAASLMLFEGAVVVIIKEHGGDYGLQKLFGTFGAIIFSPIAGKLIDATSSHFNREDYSACIVLYFFLRLIVSVLIFKLSLDFKPPAKKVFKNLGKVLCRPSVMSYLTAFSIAGMLWGFVETFLFWYLEDLGASKFLMGISLAVGTLAGLPTTIFSRLLIQKLGHGAIVVSALGLYSIRFLGYSLLPQIGVELALVFEFLKPLCTTLLLISAMTFVKDVSPVTTAASMEGLFGSMYFGVGRGLGGLVGAYAWESYGGAATFRLFSIGSMASALMYSGFALAQRRKSSNKFLLERKNESLVVEEEKAAASSA